MCLPPRSDPSLLPDARAVAGRGDGARRARGRDGAPAARARPRGPGARGGAARRRRPGRPARGAPGGPGVVLRAATAQRRAGVAVGAAQRLADRRGVGDLEVEDVLAAVLGDPDSAAVAALERLGVDVGDLWCRAVAELDRGQDGGDRSPRALGAPRSVRPGRVTVTAGVLEVVAQQPVQGSEVAFGHSEVAAQVGQPVEGGVGCVCPAPDCCGVQASPGSANPYASSSTTSAPGRTIG